MGGLFGGGGSAPPPVVQQEKSAAQELQEAEDKKALEQANLKKRQRQLFTPGGALGQEYQGGNDIRKVMGN